MEVRPLAIPDVLLLTPQVHADERGVFFESFHARKFRESTGLNATFVQDNHVCSNKGVLRGLHYQYKHTQGKLVRVVVGEVFDVAVDLRRSSPNFGHWVGERLSASNRCQMWIPEGFAHGYLVMSESAELLYKTTDHYNPTDEYAILWSDSTLGIAWPLVDPPVLSRKDQCAKRFSEAVLFD